MLGSLGNREISEMYGSEPVPDCPEAMQYATTIGPWGVFTNCGFTRHLAALLTIAWNSSDNARTKNAQVSFPSSPLTKAGNVPTSCELICSGILVSLLDQKGSVIALLNSVERFWLDDKY